MLYSFNDIRCKEVINIKSGCRLGNPDDIANMVLYLCSDMAGFITGENICIDGGMTHQMIYHDDFGWHYQPETETLSS